MNFPAQAGTKTAIETPQAELSPVDGANSLIDSLPVMAWTMTKDGVLNFINRQWYVYTGCPRDHVPGITRFNEWVHPQDHAVIYQTASNLADKETLEFEFRLRSHVGEYRRCLARAVKVRNSAGQVTQWVGTTIDVEDMRRATDQLKLQEDHYQLALESADVGIWRLQMPSMELTVDERTRRHLDLDRNVITGYQPQDHIHPQDYARSAAIQVPLGDGRYETEHRVKQRDGTYRWQAIHWRVYFEGEGALAAPALITGTSMDITPRKQAEEEKEELGRRYLMALDAAELGTWNYDVKQRLFNLDARARAHFDINQPTLTFEQYLACIHEPDREQTIAAVRRKVTNPATLGRATVEFRVRYANGELRWLSSQVNLKFAEDSSEIVSVIGVTRDITEKKQAEIKLRESEERLRQFAENVDDVLWLADPSTMRVLFVSPAYERLWGRKTTDLLADQVDLLQGVHPADRNKLEQLTPQQIKRGFAFEFRIIRPDGSTIWARDRCFPIYNDHGELVHVGGIIEDITERRQIEESLRMERERFDRMVAVAPGVLFSYQRAAFGIGRFIYVTASLADLHGVTQEEITREPSAMFRWVPTEDMQHIYAIYAAAITPMTLVRNDYRVQHPTKGLIWVSSTTTQMQEPDGSITLHGILVDVTARKQAEEQVQQLNMDLELRVQQRTAELTAANEELESFAYSVSHDLRAPLRAMWGFCDALIEDYGDSLPPEAREYLQHVIDGSRHLGEIVDGLLALSRSTRGALRRDPVDLSNVAEKMLRDLARAEPERRVTWAIQPGLRACGDSRMISVVMRNLLGNAWKYTANRSDATIRIYGDYVHGDYLFCVEDNGAGFNMEHAAKLFQPFQRLHRQDEFQGLGIGLATVQRIIHRHGGTVHGTGVPGQGALFRFSLPLPVAQITNISEQKEAQ